MAIGSGLGSQLSIGAEATYGTVATAIDHHYEFISESLRLEEKSFNSRALQAGRLVGSAARKVYTVRNVTGDIEMEISEQKMGLLFKHMLGTSSSYTHVSSSPDDSLAHAVSFTLGDMYGLSLSIQKGVPLTTGTVTPFTCLGCKITDWTIGFQPDAPATLKLGVHGQDMVTTESLASATYTESPLFHYGQGSITVGGSSVANILSGSISGRNAMKTDRWYMGSSGKVAQPIQNGMVEITGSFDIEWVDKTAVYDVWRAQNDVAVVVKFENPTHLDHSDHALCQITLSAVYFEGETPQIKGPDVVTMSTPFTALDNGSSEPITILYQTLDSAN